MLLRLRRRLGQLLFAPGTLPPGLLGGLALAPPTAAGLIYFHQPAAIIAAAALIAGMVAAGLGRLLGGAEPWWAFVPVLTGAGLLGSQTPPLWILALVGGAAALETLRLRFAQGLPLHSGLVAYAAVLLLSRGAPIAYVNPASQASYQDPIRLWQLYFRAADAPIDPVRLYLGNVAGPVFATSILALALTAAWLWYCRRGSLAVVAAYIAGSAAAAAYLRWNIAFHVLCAPCLYVAVLVLSDRHGIAESRVVGSLVAAALGAAGVAIRSRGYSFEALLVLTAAASTLYALARVGIRAGSVWRRRRAGPSPAPARKGPEPPG